MLKNTLITCLIVYFNLTTMEWLVHKYVMHAYDRPDLPLIAGLVEDESASHWVHHHEVLSDMTLDIKTKTDKHDGLFFHHRATIFFTLIVFALLTLQFKIFKVRASASTTALITLTSTIGYSFLWNNFHAALHGENDIIIPGVEGVTNRYQKYILPWVPRIWFEWMMYNHAQHHAVKGTSKGNYNIILPGFDYIMGTYNTPPCFDNTAFCKHSDLKSCDQPKGCFKIDDRGLVLV